MRNRAAWIFLVPCLVAPSFASETMESVGGNAPVGSESQAEVLLSAQSELPSEVKEALEELGQGRFQNRILSVVNALLGSAREALIARGQESVAEQLHQEWQDVQFSMNYQAGTLELGDHRPLSRWLDDVYQRLESTLGVWICHRAHFDDLRVLNFSIPVATDPRAERSPGDRWDESEYLRHFVPLTGAVTYWTANAACQMGTSGWVSAFCRVASEAPRWVAERWVAPPLGARVYRSAASQTSSP